MELPEVIYTLIGEFVLSFPHKSKYEQDLAKKNLARTIVSSYPEYVEYLVDNCKIPNFNDFKGLCKQADEKLRNDAENAITNYKLEEFRDIIMENYALNIPKLINVARYIYLQTKDINKSCDIYCKLGYPGYKDIAGNGDYIINFMGAWVDFATQNGFSKEISQCRLLCSFEDIDTEDYGPIFDIKSNKGIFSFFPFSIENVDKLVDFILKLDDFDSEEFKAKIGLIDSPNETKSQSSYLISDETANLSILCNYYVYIFNKLNEDYPLSAFAVCAYSKWLSSNVSIISHYIPELSKCELQSLLYDYSLDNYSDITSIPENDIVFHLVRNYYEDIIEIMYKLHYRTELSCYELTDIWVYFVINKSLTYSNHKSKETAAILQVSDTEYPDNGDILLPWKYVRYVDGKAFFYHPNHEKGTDATLPFKFEFDKAQKSFMDISKGILWNFPFILCKTENGQIVSVDENFAKYVISDLAYIHKVLSRRKAAKISSSSTAKDILLQYKSQQFSILEKKQLKRIDIIPILENTSNTTSQKEEPALLFTVAANTETYTLVYENTSISRASYVFIIERNSYDNCVKLITSYFTSKQTNKRAELQYSRDMFNKSDGFLRVIRVLHDNNSNWEDTINFYSKR